MARNFFVGGVVDSKTHYAVDRSVWHNDIANALAGGEFLLLHGHRQGGKSTAACAVTAILEAQRFEARYCPLSITLESTHAIDTQKLWSDVECLLRAAIKRFRPVAERGPELPILSKLDEFPDEPLFQDSTSFQQFLESPNWGTWKVVMIIDELDTLLLADGLARRSFLASVRALRTVNGLTSTSSQPYALHAFLGIGVRQLLNLTTQSAGAGHTALPPFNITTAITIPETTIEAVKTMVGGFASDVHRGIPDSIVTDIFWRSGGHVGLISLLCQRLAELCMLIPEGDEVTDSAWATCISGTHLLGELRASATVGSMLRSFGPTYAITTPEREAARQLLRNLLSAPQDAWLNIHDGSCSMHNALSVLLSEGIITEKCHDWDLRYRIVAPLVVPLLMRDVGSRTNVAALPKRRFPRKSDGTVDLITAVLEVLPFVDKPAIFHAYALRACGRPCESAYHFQLFDLLSRRTAEGGWRVVGQTCNANAPGPFRRLDLLISSNERTCGIDVLTDGKDMGKHVYELAPAYMKQQHLSSVLVVNMAVEEASIVTELAQPLPEGVEVLQVLVDYADDSLTPYTLQGENPHKAIAMTPLWFVGPKSSKSFSSV